MTAVPGFIVTYGLKVPGSMPATFWQDFAFGEFLRRQHTQSYFNVGKETVACIIIKVQS